MLGSLQIIHVSIPRRDFWVFQRDLFFASIQGPDGVSIPRRDFWVFQLWAICLREASIAPSFQSLEGIFGFFNGFAAEERSPNRMASRFNP
ncbi:hypothetical protein CKA32_000664 [Geitlerinema sp. FC II]|nr:hypothetical protein CKA32_000664 [Geitlerinema sp. FC II]